MVQLAVRRVRAEEVMEDALVRVAQEAARMGRAAVAQAAVEWVEAVMAVAAPAVAAPAVAAMVVMAKAAADLDQEEVAMAVAEGVTAEGE